MKMIMKLLFLLDLWLGVIDISNANYVKKDKQRINANSMASNEGVGLVYNKI